jgi:hypothetical protein
MLTWPEALQMQSKVDNVMTNLNMLINDYSTISKAFSKYIDSHKNKPPKIPTDELYNNAIIQNETLKNFGDGLVNNIHEIKANLETLEMNISDVEELGIEIIKIINTRKMSDLQNISSITLENNMDTRELTPEHHEFIENLLDLNQSRMKKGGKTLKKKHAKMRFKRVTKNKRQLL